MKVRYSQEVDDMYIMLDSGEYRTSEKVGDGVVLDFTKEGDLVGIQIADASEKISKENFNKIMLNNN